MDSRFSDAANATPPRRACPARSMFLAAVWSRCRLVPPAGQECQRTDKPFRDDHPTAARVLRGVRRGDGDDFPTGACCLVGKHAQERCPPGIVAALGEMAVLEHIGRLEMVVIDRLVRTHERERRVVVKVLPLAL